MHVVIHVHVLYMYMYVVQVSATEPGQMVSNGALEEQEIQHSIHGCDSEGYRLIQKCIKSFKRSP